MFLLITVVSQLSLCPECPPAMILPEECPQVVETEKKKKKQIFREGQTAAGTECFFRLEEAPQNSLDVLCISCGFVAWKGGVNTGFLKKVLSEYPSPQAGLAKGQGPQRRTPCEMLNCPRSSVLLLDSTTPAKANLPKVPLG